MSQNRHFLLTEHSVTERQWILHDPITRILRTYDQIASLTPFNRRRFVSLLRRWLQVDSGLNQESKSPFVVGDYFQRSDKKHAINASPFASHHRQVLISWLRLP
jgi:hypothetical protein